VNELTIPVNRAAAARREAHRGERGWPRKRSAKTVAPTFTNRFHHEPSVDRHQNGQQNTRPHFY
jgi:hypothetical protein